MKSKLVKYPFNEKKYEWDSWDLGRKFEYTWDKSTPRDFDTIQPYVPVQDYDPTLHSDYKVVDFGVEPGEQVNIEGHGSTVTASRYAMSYLPEETISVNHNQKAYIALTNQERAGTWNLVEQEQLVNHFYYTLTYTTQEMADGKTQLLPVVKFYKDDNALRENGLTISDVAIFNCNFNINELCGLYMEHNKNNVPWEGPFDTPQDDFNFWLNTDSVQYQYFYDGLEFKTSDNKYYYLRAYRTTNIVDKFVGAPRDLPFTNVNIIDTESAYYKTPDNTYTYSYGEGREGIINEYYKYGGIATRSGPRVTTYFNGSAKVRNNILPPDYDNGEFTGVFILGNRLPFTINHDYTVPIYKSGTHSLSWCPALLNSLADIIVKFTFNLPDKFYNDNYDKDVWPAQTEYETVYPEVPIDSEIYESLCHYRTSATEQLGILLGSYITRNIMWQGISYGDYVKVRYYTPLFKEYLFKDRIFEFNYNDEESNVPQRDWFSDNYINDIKLEHDWPTDDDLAHPERFPKVTNEMGWNRAWVPKTHPSPHAFSSRESVSIIGTVSKDIMPRLTNKEFVNEPVSKFGFRIQITKEQYDEQYPFSYFVNSVNNQKIRYLKSNEEWVNDKFAVSYETGSGRYYIRLSPVGYYKYSGPIDTKEGGAHWSDKFADWECYEYSITFSGSYGGQSGVVVDYTDPIISVGEKIDLIQLESAGGYAWWYSYTLPTTTFAAGWGQSTYYSRGEVFDAYQETTESSNNIVISYENIYLVPSTMPSGIFDYLDIDIDAGKYIDTPKYVLPSNNVYFIQDETDEIITIPDNNEEIFSYTIGGLVDGVFTPKPLLYNAVCEYSGSSNRTRTWLTFNTYSVDDWYGPWHFAGNNWNCLSSPLAYACNITDENAPKFFYFGNKTFAPSGKFVNALTLYKDFEMKDKDGNTYDYTYDELNGGIPTFVTTVKSYNKEEYPEEGYYQGYVYRMRKQDTKFIEYFEVRDNLANVELITDRYHYSHENVDLCDRSYEGTTCGTTTSTGEENIPEATWREYIGLYLGTSIPFLHIEEQHIEPSELLGVPVYDKQVNTSDTLKYGTVASASLSMVLNKPVANAMQYNNLLLILYYDFNHDDNWERMGFFRIDTINALDENTTSVIAHDEVFKLNTYVDDFLENYTQTTTLDLFYRDLLNYCGCLYDTHQAIIHNGTLSMTNVYHAVKTTGVQVAHYVAILVPGFIHANIDGDIVMSQYQTKNDTLTKNDYTNLVYSAYNTDKLNKIKITSSNTVKGESTGTGINAYYLADDPLLSELQATSYFNDLANSIVAYYNNIPAYRPAKLEFLVLPRGLQIGDIVDVVTPNNEQYKITVMKMSISSSGLEIQSYGTQKYPVEAESNSEFVNLINDMGEISGDVSNMMEAQRTMAAAIAANREDIDANSASITAIQTKDAQQDNTLASHTTSITNINTTLGNYKTTTANNLATITLSNTLNNVALKDYVDAGDTSTLNSAKAYTDSLVGTSMSMKFGTIRWSMSSSGTIKSVHCIFIGSNDKRNGIFIPTAYVADDYNKTYMFRVYNNSYYVLYDDGSSTTKVGWFEAYNTSFTED